MNKPLHIQILEALQQNNAIGRFVDIKYLFVDELNTKAGRKNFKDELDYLATAGLITAETSYAFLIWDTLGGLYPLDNKKISLRLTGTWETYLINKRGALKRGEPQHTPQVAEAKVQRRSASEYTPVDARRAYPAPQNTQQKQTLASALPLPEAVSDTTPKEITPDMPEYYTSAKTYHKKHQPGNNGNSKYSEKDADIPRVNLVFPEKEDIAPLDAVQKFFSLKPEGSRKEKKADDAEQRDVALPQAKEEAAKPETATSRSSDPAFIATLSKLFGSKSKPGKPATEEVPQPAEPMVQYVPEPEPVAVPVVNEPAAAPVPRIIPQVSRLTEQQDNAPFITARTAFLKVKDEPKVSAWANSNFEAPQQQPLIEPVAQYIPETIAPPVVLETSTFTDNLNSRSKTAYIAQSHTGPEFEPAKPWVNKSEVSDKLKPLSTSWDGPEVVFEPRTRRKKAIVPPAEAKQTTTKSVWDEPEEVTPPVVTKEEAVKPSSVWDEPEEITPPITAKAEAVKPVSVWDEPEEKDAVTLSGFEEQVVTEPLNETVPPSAQLQEEVWVEPKLRPKRPVWPHLPEPPAQPEAKHTPEPEPVMVTPEPEYTPEPQAVYQPEPEVWHTPVTPEPEHTPEPQAVYQPEPEAWRTPVTPEPEHTPEPQAIYQPEPEAWRPTVTYQPETKPEPDAWSVPAEPVPAEPVTAPWRKPYTVPEPVDNFETNNWQKPEPVLHNGPEPWPNEEYIPKPGLHQNEIFIPTPREPEAYHAAKNIPHTLVPISEMAPGAAHLRDARAPGSPVKPQVVPSSVHFAMDNNPFADLEIIPIVNDVHDAIEKKASRAWIKWAIGGVLFLIFLVAFLAYKHRYYS